MPGRARRSSPPGRGRPYSRPSSRAAPPELRELRIDPRRSLGQNFLTDEDVLARIAALTGGPTRRVLEVGAGYGALTAHLLKGGARVLAVEIDEALCAYVRQRFQGQPLRVAYTDVLALSPAELLALGDMEPPYVMVGNLPYYITAPVLRHFLEADTPPERMIVMVQKEVGERMAARPPRMSLLGVAVRAYAEARLAFVVQPHAFFPSPKVDSAVVVMELRRHPALPPDEETFFLVVRAGFSQPRKQLHNALNSRLWMPPGAAAGLLEEAGIDSMRRAGSLSIEEWARLTDAYERARPAWGSGDA